MPEGPSIVILNELLTPFSGRTVTEATGNARIDMDRITGQKIVAFRSFGKHTLICFEDFFIRIHLLMFGTYRINERKESKPRLSLVLGKDEINFYTCSVILVDGDVKDHYSWEHDTMSDEWNHKKAVKLVKAQPDEMACDILLDQDLFAGVGNIIKNEVLFRVKVHPETRVGNLPAKKLTEMVEEARNYCFDFYRWKKEYTLKQHWLAHRKRTCTRCDIPLVKKQTGHRKRRSFYCEECQKLY